MSDDDFGGPFEPGEPPLASTSPDATDAPVDREVEREWKLRAATALAPAAVEAALREATRGFELDPAVGGTHVDAYLDDAERSLQRHGIGLRLRRDGSAATVCCKLRLAHAGGLHERREFEQPWTAASPPQTAGELPLRLRDAVEPFARNRPLLPLVHLEVHRERHLVRRDGTVVAEIAIDHVEATGAGRRATFAEIEIEVRDDEHGSRQLAERLGAHLPVHAADDDKPTHALQLLGIAGDDFAARASAERAHDRQLGDWIGDQLHRLLDELALAESRVRLDGSMAAVHSLRVALRRTRVFLRAFRAAWPARILARLHLPLATASNALAEVRARDAFAARLPTILAQLPPELQTAAPALSEHLAAERATALAAALAHLRADPHHADMADLQQLADPAAMAGDIAALPAHRAARALRRSARKARRRTRALSAEPTIEELHRLRLGLKQLRALLGWLVDADERGPAGLRRRLRAALLKLGEACDCRAAALVFAARDPATLPAPLAALVGAIATHQWLGGQGAMRAARHAARRLDRRRYWRWFATRRTP